MYKAINAEKYLVNNAVYLKGVLNLLDPTFKKLDSFSEKFLTLNLDSSNAVKKIATDLTGYHFLLVPLQSKVATLKTQKEAAYYYQKKIEIEEAGNKFVDAVTKKEASLYVAEERDVRNRIESYIAVCLEGLKSCRNFINDRQPSNGEYSEQPVSG